MLKIYKASAGSGKTYTLALEYIKMLLGIKPEDAERYRLNLPKYTGEKAMQPNRHRFILAITFTNKATEEMKRRILKELDDLSHIPAAGADDANYAKDLCEEYGCSREELAEVARTALNQLLCDYHYFHVTTIDSFFQRVLRTFARELDHPGDFNVEINDIVAVNTAVGTMIDDFNANYTDNSHITDWLLEYLDNQMQEGKKTNFFNRNSRMFGDMVDLVNKINEESFKKYITAMRDYLIGDGNNDPDSKLKEYRRQLKKSKEKYSELLQQEARQAIELLSALGSDLDKMSGTCGNLGKFLYGLFLEGKFYEKEKNYLLGGTVQKAIDKESKLYNKGCKLDVDACADVFSEFYTRARELYTAVLTIDRIQASLEQLFLLAYVWRYLDAFIAENNTILLSDTTNMLSRIIGADETPFVYERMGVQLHHFLIDEFQDTSKMQWSNLRPLVANSMSGYYDNLIIGDEKQSIYRFRNSDSSLLHHQVPNVDFPVDGKNTVIKGGAPGENTNYRSAADIVRFNNTLFDVLARQLEIEGYENVIQDIPKKHLDLKGFVRFIPYGAEFMPEGETDEKKNKKAEEKAAIEARQMQMIVENILDQHERGYRWCDIAVLVFKNEHAATFIDYVMSNGYDIPVLSDEALYLQKSSAVQMIISMLKIIAGEMTHSRKKNADEEKRKYPTAAEVKLMMSRYNYFVSKGDDAQTAVNKAVEAMESEANSELVAGIEAIRAENPSTLSALVETIIRQQLTEEDRVSQVAYLTAFQDFVLEFSAYNNPSLKAFIDYWELRKDKLSVQAPADVNAVRLMTIHKSKGLEFDCVHVPFGSGRQKEASTKLWVETPAFEGVDPKIAPPALYVTLSEVDSRERAPLNKVYKKEEHAKVSDALNVLYVAYTRAGRELCVYYEPGKGHGVKLNKAFACCTGMPGDDRTADITGFYDRKTGALSFGTPTFKEEMADTSDTNVVTTNLDGYEVYSHPGAKVYTTLDDMLDLDADDDAKTDVEDLDKYVDEEARQRGIILHDALSFVYTYADIDTAVERVSLHGRLSEEDKQKLAARLRQMIDIEDPLIRRWYVDCERVLNEQTIYDPVADRQKRLDRLVFCSDGHIDVVDYKFTSEKEPSHRKQVRGYLQLLNRMGYTNLRGYLWYPLIDNDIIELSL